MSLHHDVMPLAQVMDSGSYCFVMIFRGSNVSSLQTIHTHRKEVSPYSQCGYEFAKISHKLACRHYEILNIDLVGRCPGQSSTVPDPQNTVLTFFELCARCDLK